MSIESGTPRKWSLWATHPKRLGCIAELYATSAVAEVRADHLRDAGYTVEIVLSNVASTNVPIVRT
jgi:hypothetical protein